MADEEYGFPINNVGNDRLRKGGAADGICIGSEAKKGGPKNGDQNFCCLSGVLRACPLSFKPSERIRGAFYFLLSPGGERRPHERCPD